MSYGRYLEKKKLNGPATRLGPPPPPPDAAAGAGAPGGAPPRTTFSPLQSPAAGVADGSGAGLAGGDAWLQAAQAKSERLAELQTEDADAAGNVGPGSPGAESQHEGGSADVQHPGLGLSTPPSPGRTGITLKKEGWLLKKTSTKPHRWQKRWFVVVTKQEHGLVAARTLQYYSKQPEHPDVETAAVDLAEPKHAIPLQGDRVLELYDGVKFRLTQGATGQSLYEVGRTYAFQAESVDDAKGWVTALTPGQEELGELLLDAAQEGNRATMTHALQTGAPVDHRTGPGLSPLQWACINGHADCVSELLLAGAVVSACSEDGWSPLHAAAYGGHPAVVAPLIAHSADLNAVSADGRTAYALAEEQGHMELMGVLARYLAEQHQNRVRYAVSDFDNSSKDPLDYDPSEDVQSAEAMAADGLARSRWYEHQPDPEPPPAESTGDKGTLATAETHGGRTAIASSIEQDHGTLFLKKSAAAGVLRGHSARTWLSPEHAADDSDMDLSASLTAQSSSLTRMADALPDVGSTSTGIAMDEPAATPNKSVSGGGVSTAA